MKNKRRICMAAAGLSLVLALPVQAKVISPGSEKVRKSNTEKTAVSPKTGEGEEESVAALLAGVFAATAVVADRKQKEKKE